MSTDKDTVQRNSQQLQTAVELLRKQNSLAESQTRRVASRLLTLKYDKSNQVEQVLRKSSIQ